jgi:hypothetical protein
MAFIRICGLRDLPDSHGAAAAAAAAAAGGVAVAAAVTVTAALLLKFVPLLVLRLLLSVRPALNNTNNL